MNAVLRPRGQDGYVTLIALLVGVVIVLMLYLVFLGGGGPHGRQTQQLLRETGPTTRAQSLPGAALERGRMVECLSNLRQLQQAIGMFQSDQERFSSSLQELAQGGWTGGMPTSCPVTGEPYAYDPQTGRVWCSTHSRQ